MERIATIGTQLTIIVLFILALLVQIVLVPLFAAEVTANFPETVSFRVPGIVWAWLVVACGQVVLVCTWSLLSMVKSSRIFSDSAFRLINVIIWCFFIAGLLSLAVIFTLSITGMSPPAVMWLLIIGDLSAVGLASIVVVLKRLLRRSSQLEHEMAQVV